MISMHVHVYFQDGTCNIQYLVHCIYINAKKCLVNCAVSLPMFFKQDASILNRYLASALLVRLHIGGRSQ